MPACEECKECFPSRTIIDGKMRNLQNRKYCLKCSPFGEHNTKTFGYVKVQQKLRKCHICDRQTKRKGELCNTCVTKMRRYRIKLEAIEYLGGKCIECGYDECPSALTFHHQDATQKHFEIAMAYRYSDEEIVAEIKKCILLCQNCHAEHHWEEDNGYVRDAIIKRIDKMDTRVFGYLLLK